jgi:hypothetical protein
MLFSRAVGIRVDAEWVLVIRNTDVNITDIKTNVVNLFIVVTAVIDLIPHLGYL